MSTPSIPYSLAPYNSRANVPHTPQNNESHFYVSLQQWRQLNLSPSFIQFANRADPLSLSMPLLLHNWRDIVVLWMTAVDAADDEALRALLEYANLRLLSFSPLT